MAFNVLVHAASGVSRWGDDDLVERRFHPAGEYPFATPFLASALLPSRHSPTQPRPIPSCTPSTVFLPRTSAARTAVDRLVDLRTACQTRIPLQPRSGPLEP